MPFQVELTPMIDVVFLLLTFFIYAMVLMDRIELVPLELKPLEAGETVSDASPPPARTLSLDGSGGLFSFNSLSRRCFHHARSIPTCRENDMTQQRPSRPITKQIVALLFHNNIRQDSRYCES